MQGWESEFLDDTQYLWNLRVDPKQGFLAIIVVESQGLPTMKCQTKCAKAILGGRFFMGRVARASRPSQ